MINQINKIIFKYLDNQNFVVTESTNKIYFVNSEEDKYAQIKYDKDDGWCYIYWRLVEEISTFFSMDESNSQEVIGKWVENILQMGVTNTSNNPNEYGAIVEYTLQMRVTNTNQKEWRYSFQVENTTTLVSFSEMRVNNTRTVPYIFPPTVESVS